MYPEEQKWLTKKKLLIGAGILAVIFIVIPFFSLMSDIRFSKDDGVSGFITLGSKYDENEKNTSAAAGENSPAPGQTPNPASAPSPSPASTPAAKSAAPAPTPSPASPSPAPAGPPQTVEIIYAEQCFNFGEPNVTINRGDTIKFLNYAEEDDFWPTSSDPTHTAYPGFDAGHPIHVYESWSFTFDRAGAWGYRDQLHPECTGTITVQ